VAEVDLWDVSESEEICIMIDNEKTLVLGLGLEKVEGMNVKRKDLLPAQP
jgi:hypothetical protein